MVRRDWSSDVCSSDLAERYRQNADDCRQRSLQARTPADKANWLKIAEEWQKLAEEVDDAELKGRAHE